MHSGPGFVSSETRPAKSSYSEFAVGWRVSKGRKIFSLRSREDGTDVREIAQRFGGGGHTHAAGFTLAYEGDILGGAGEGEAA